jgi:hypothetical protein
VDWDALLRKMSEAQEKADAALVRFAETVRRIQKDAK